MLRVTRTWLWRLLIAVTTYFLINITWVFFRAQDFATAWRMIGSMLVPHGGIKVLPTVQIALVTVTIGLMLLVHWAMRSRSLDQVVARTPWWLTSLALASMAFAIIITQGSGDAFIYFQF